MSYQKIVPQSHGGVVYREGIYFHSPSDFAKENLYYTHFGGMYTCDSDYEIDREYYHAFLLFRILKGSLHFKYRNRSFIARDGDVIFLDCKEYHRYWAESPVSFQWFHFDGCSTQAYFNLLYAQHGACFSNISQLYFQFNYILEELKSETPNDHKLSFLINNIIGILALPHSTRESPIIQKARQYILENYNKDIAVSDIAEYVALNKFYFSKLFKNTTGISPHQYLSYIRIKHAKRLLAETEYSVSHIAATCGFSCDSHFIRAFKKDTAFTPMQFRKYFDSSEFQNQPLELLCL